MTTARIGMLLKPKEGQNSCSSQDLLTLHASEFRSPATGVRLGTAAHTAGGESATNTREERQASSPSQDPTRLHAMKDDSPVTKAGDHGAVKCAARRSVPRECQARQAAAPRQVPTILHAGRQVARCWQYSGIPVKLSAVWSLADRESSSIVTG